MDSYQLPDFFEKHFLIQKKSKAKKNDKIMVD
jgi:hypothetical protein